MSKDKVKRIAPHHIEPGIEKYKGKINQHLQAVIKNAGLDYTPYTFNDGRILLVLPNNISGFLYSDEDTLYDFLDLKSY